jgi:hypothetical protein
MKRNSNTGLLLESHTVCFHTQEARKLISEAGADIPRGDRQQSISALSKVETLESYDTVSDHNYFAPSRSVTF